MFSEKIHVRWLCVLLAIYLNVGSSVLFQVEIWNVDMVTKEHGNGPMPSTDVITGLLRIDQDGHKAVRYDL